VLSPFRVPSIYDYVTIAGQRSPGLARVGRFVRKYPWDIKDGKGAFGSTSTLPGVPVVRGGPISFVLWTDQHFQEWETWSAIFDYDPTKPVSLNAVDIDYPSLALIHLTSVVCQEITNPVHMGGGKWEAEIKLLEYHPPKPVAAVATPTITVAEIVIEGEETDPRQIEIANKKKIAAALQIGPGDSGAGGSSF
jgi:hypothetical protein